MPLPFYKPSPAPQAVFSGLPSPRRSANPLSRVFFHWFTPLLKVGYSRPLLAEDLWELDDDLACRQNAERLQYHYLNRLPRSLHPMQNGASQQPAADLLKPGQIAYPPMLTNEEKVHDKKHSKRNSRKIASGELAYDNGRYYDMSFSKAIFRANLTQVLLAVSSQIIGNILIVTSPLITQRIVDQIVKAHDHHTAVVSGEHVAGDNPAKSVGFSIGLVFALFFMLCTGALFQFQAAQVAGILGAAARTATVDLISRKSMRLSGKARLTMTNGRINNLVSTDSMNTEWAFPNSYEIPAAIIQILVGSGLLIHYLGYSALAGLGVMVISVPLQWYLFLQVYVVRQAQQLIIDDRIRLFTEVINNIRAVKVYSYEDVFAHRIMKFREAELRKMRWYALIRTTTNSMFYFTPVLAAIISFVTYSLTGHELNAATVFAALQLWNILRDPIQRLPMMVCYMMDSLVSMRRIGDMLKSEELVAHLNIDENESAAARITGDFQYDIDSTIDQEEMNASEEETQTHATKDKSGAFTLRDLDVSIPRGSLVCVVGRIGTGKSSMLLAMVNEMRKIRGIVVFGGSVSYVPQQAWVQSGTVRDNITFSKPGNPDLERVNQVIDACALRSDIEMWRDGDQTLIGERGITLSGGQRQRICIARAVYEESTVILLDDPLSAVDAHVGHHLLENCLLSGPLTDRTRILVTHHLDVLPHADLILVMDRNDRNEGRIVQQGTYAVSYGRRSSATANEEHDKDLSSQEGIFQSLVKDFGSSDKDRPSDSDDEEEGETLSSKEDVVEEHISDTTVEKPSDELEGHAGHVTIEEERFTGEVSWTAYKRYVRSINSWVWVSVCVFFLVATQAAQIGYSLFLGYWSGQSIKGFSQAQYMAVYGGLGAAYSLGIWASNYAFILSGIGAGFGMFNEAFFKVMHSPARWHDSTPTGRIISRLTRDVKMLDDKLMQFWYSFFFNAAAFVGTFILVVYTYPWLGLAYIPLLSAFFLCAIYYRATSREVKRLDSNLRSHVYSTFAEQLAGLTVIRAFGQQHNFQTRMQSSMDNQNRAYILTIYLQRWLGVRLELCGDLLILLIALFGCIFRDTVNAARFGVVLSFALSAAQSITWIVPVFAICEQEMNNVERIQYYMDLETEAATYRESDPSSHDWPSSGDVVFDDVQLKYRPDLPLVLKGVSFKIRPGEKVGIIGRTGAGKSSILQALFRTVEITGGQISIDGLDLKSLGLFTLRNGIAVIPQDAFLFAGTVRDNMDPRGLKSDAELNDALNLIQNSASASHSLRDKFKLDASVMAGGDNFSAGEKQLLALMRALVRGCKVLLLDEATSSVDPETDALIQKIIQTEFSHVTLISIAHRLQTVAFYDRILVMDAGQIAEFDTPLNLFDDPDSIFRTMCQKKKLTRQDLIKIQADAAAAIDAHNKATTD